ncbi:MAG TPA: hypothetical protein VF517_15150 [Thermoleophilaceae bacterium]|jgi:hypothetical protein
MEGRSKRSDGSGGSVSGFVGTLPAYLGMSLAAIYALGALEARGQLSESGVRTLDALPVIPVEQLLARGIWAVTEPLPLVLAVVLVTQGLAALFFRVREYRGREDTTAGLLKGMALAIALLAIALAMMPPAMIPRVLFAGVGYGGVALVLGLRHDWRPESLRFVAVTGSVFAVIFAMTGTYFAPDPLPDASIQTESSVVRGRLIAATDATWYLADRGRVRAIPANHVRSAEVTKRDLHRSESLLRSLLD